MEGRGNVTNRERRRVGRWRRLQGVKPGRRKRPAAAVRRPRGPTNDRQRTARRSERTALVHASKTFPCHLNSSKNFVTPRAESLIQFGLRSLTSQSTLTRARAGDKNRNNARNTSSAATGQQSSARKRRKYTSEIAHRRTTRGQWLYRARYYNFRQRDLQQTRSLLRKHVRSAELPQVSLYTRRSRQWH